MFSENQVVRFCFMIIYIVRFKRKLIMKIFTTMIVILFSFSTNTFATEYKFVAGDNKSTTQLCLAAVTDNTSDLIKKLRILSRRGTALSFRSFVNTIQCNKQFIGNFALQYKAQNAFVYLNQFTNQSNKNRQPDVTIKDLAKNQKTDEDQRIIVLVTGN